MGQIQLVVALVMIGLFTFAVVGFAVNFGNDNNSAVNLADDPELALLKSNTGGNLSSFRSESEDTYQSILETTIESGGDVPQNVAPFSIVNPLGAIKNIFQVGYIKIFGTGSGFGVFFTTFIALLGFILGLFIYKTLKGMPD